MWTQGKWAFVGKPLSQRVLAFLVVAMCLIASLAEAGSSPFTLEAAVGSQKSAQPLDAPGTIKKCLITTEVPTTFFLSPCTPIAYTAFLRPTAVSRLTITIGTFFPYYSPPSVEVGSGASISWENPTFDLHSITHDACRTNERCAFDSGAIGPNRTFTLHQLPPGYYPYHCSFHPIMRGTLVVNAPDFPGET